MQVRLAVSTLLLAAAFVAHPARGDEKSDSGTFSVQAENDFFGSDHSDKHYSQGVRFTWVPPASLVDTRSGSGVAPTLARLVPGFAPAETDAGTAKVRVAYSIGQSLFTPTDLRRRIPDPTDRPYAGWLYGGITLVSEREGFDERLTQLRTFGVDLGVVGPSALGKQTQQGFHRFLGGDQVIPRGWDRQIDDEPALLVTYDQKWRFELPVFRHDPQGFAIDATPSIGANVGNVYTGASTGLTLRFGQRLPNDYGPPRIRPGLAGSDFVQRPVADDHFFGWYLFGGVEGRAVLHNIFLDGSSFRSGPSVEKRNFVADFQSGLALTLGGVRLTYTHVWRTREFDAQRGNDKFGSIALSANF